MTGPDVGPLAAPHDVPPWLRPLLAATEQLDPGMFRRLAVLGEDAREAAVLILLGEQDHHGPDVLLQLRAVSESAHSGQVAFPGGGVEPQDDGPVSTALREAVEETGLDPGGVLPIALLPTLHIPVSRFHVTPVLAHWHAPSAVRAVDVAETAAVARVPLSRLADPANRFQVRHRTGFVGPAFALRADGDAPGMLVWGFTAGVLTLLLAIGGFEQPWDSSDVRDLDVAWRSISAGTSGGLSGGPRT